MYPLFGYIHSNVFCVFIVTICSNMTVFILTDILTVMHPNQPVFIRWIQGILSKVATSGTRAMPPLLNKFVSKGCPCHLFFFEVATGKPNHNFIRCHTYAAFLSTPSVIITYPGRCRRLQKRPRFSAKASINESGNSMYSESSLSMVALWKITAISP